MATEKVLEERIVFAETTQAGFDDVPRSVDLAQGQIAFGRIIVGIIRLLPALNRPPALFDGLVPRRPLTTFRPERVS